MLGKGSLSSVLVVRVLFFVSFSFAILLYIFFSMRGYLLLFCLTEEEASMLRSFVDQPAFTDLHWVHFSISCPDGVLVYKDIGVNENSHETQLVYKLFCRECLFLLSKDKEPRNSSRSGCLWRKRCK